MMNQGNDVDPAHFEMDKQYQQPNQNHPHYMWRNNFLLIIY